MRLLDSRLLPLTIMAILMLPTAVAVITTEPNRIDLPPQPLGSTFERPITVINRGDAETRVTVEVESFEGERVHVEPRTLVLPQGGRANVTVRVELEQNISGGRHDVRLLFIEDSGASGRAVARSAVLVPVIFQVENLKIGGVRVQDPAPGADAVATILVQNYLPDPEEAEVVLVVFDARGAEVARVEQRTEAVPVNETRAIELIVPTRPLPAGAYTVRTVATAAAAGSMSNAFNATMTIGERRLTIELAAPESGRAEAAVRVRVSNEGTLSVAGQAVVRFLQGDVVVHKTILEVPSLRPGEVREFDVAPPGVGRYEVHAKALWTNGESAATTISAEWKGDSGGATKVPLTPALVPLALVLALALRRR